MLEVEIEPCGRVYIIGVSKTIKNLSDFDKIKFEMLDEIKERMFNINYVFEEIMEYTKENMKEEIVKKLSEKYSYDIYYDNKYTKEEGIINLSNLIFDSTIFGFKKLLDIKNKVLKKEDKLKYEDFSIEELKFEIYNSFYYQLDNFDIIGKNKEFSERFENIIKNNFNNSLSFRFDECCEIGKYVYINPMVTFKVI